MLALHGTGVSDGIAIGKAYVLQRDLPEIPEYTIAHHQVETEIERLARATDAARRQLIPGLRISTAPRWRPCPSPPTPR